jgi:phosphatidyl-myo-inositol alpha-mannosyltransferase
MRVALVSPYSWSQLGGVNDHIAALAAELRRLGDDAVIMAPFDPPGLLTRLTHGSAPARPDVPDVPLGRSVSVPANGARSNLCLSPWGVARLRTEIRRGGFDVVHVHEPVAPLIGPAVPFDERRPIVATFHAYSTSALPNLFARALGARRVFNRIAERIAVSTAAEWTGRRWFGGRYHVIPNGVDLTRAPAGPKPPSSNLRVLFVGRAEPRKGLPLLLAAFDALVERAPATLTVVGARPQEVLPFLEPDTARRVTVLGRVSDEELWHQLHAADVLCAPSLWGESFGMILIEAFAAGTPVVASAIAGYSDVVEDLHDGILVAPGDARALGEALWSLARDRGRLERMGRAARLAAERYAWPRVAGQVREVYQLASERLSHVGDRARLRRRWGLSPADGLPSVPPRRLPSLDPPLARRAAHLRRVRRASAFAVAVLIAALLIAYAVGEFDLRRTATLVAGSNAGWLAIGAALMAVALILRALCWRTIARAALPGRALRFSDCASATAIGALVSAVLPGRAGEPTRALVVSRRVGRVQSSFPTLLGTIVVQSVINAAALIMLGVVVALTSGLVSSHPYVLPALLALPALAIGVLELLPRLARKGAQRKTSVTGWIVRVLVRVHKGLAALRQPRLIAAAAIPQLAAWAAQAFACYTVSRALSFQGSIGLGAAAAVLFGVNVAAAVPLTPSNVGVFQLAVLIVLGTGYGVRAADAVGYGLVLQAVEFVTAVALGVPSLLREGLTWRDLQVEAFRAVQLAPGPQRLSARAGPRISQTEPDRSRVTSGST